MSLILTILLFIVIFGLIIVIHEGGHFVQAKREGMKVKEFAFGFPPRLWSKRNNGTRFSINAVPLGGYVSIEGEDQQSDDPDAFNKKSPWARLRVVLAGVTMNILLAWVLLILFLWIAPLFAQPDAVAVTTILPGSAAETAGLQVNDFIIAANGTAIESDTDLTEFTTSHKGEEVSLTILRNGAEQTLTTTLDDGDTSPLGVSIVDIGDVPDVPWYMAPVDAAIQIVNVTLFTLAFIGQLIANLFGAGGEATVQHVSGPVGIFGLLRQIQILGVPAIINFSAMISLAVAIFNLIPFPALDGGRAVLLFFEGIFKRPILKPQTEGLIHAIGFFILIALILVVTYFDIQKLG